MKALITFLGAVALSVSANAALYDRGNGLIYDDVLDITWLQDANYAKTSGYATDPSGRMSWDQANVWINQLTYAGYDDWRLPSANLMNPTHPCNSYDGSCDLGSNNTTGELGHMYYNNLGNLSPYDTNGELQSNWELINTSFTDANTGETVSFLNVQENQYWYIEDLTPSTCNDCAWSLAFDGGFQGYSSTGYPSNAWAVRDGDVVTTPIPAAAWLFGSALIGLVGLKRRAA